MLVRKGRVDEGSLADNPLGVWLRQQEQQLSGPPRGSWGAEPADTAAADSTEPIGPVDGAAAGPRPEPWDLEPEVEPRADRPRPRLLMLAAVPWVLAVLLAIGLFAGGDEQATTAPVEPAAPSAPPTPDPAPTPAQVLDPPRPSTDPAFGEVAALAVRSALSGPIAGGAPRARFVEDAVATGAERVGDVVFVTVSALVLEGGPNGWDTARVRRYAIPVSTGSGGPAAVGAPWPIADQPPAPPSSPSHVTDPAVVEAVHSALTRAGYSELQGVAVTRDPVLTGVLLAHVEATGPAQTGAGAWDVWLRDGPEPSVLGDPAAVERPGQPPTPPGDAEDPR